jgi:phospholipid/cholesterol/gamma-HCH transport system ATP-binding protein
MDNLIDLHDVYYARDERGIFKGVTLSIPRGKVTAIMGPSGTGKTTLLNLIGGQLYADKGSVKMGGQDLASLSQADLYALRRRMGMMFQNSALFTNISVFDNIAYPLREHTHLSEAMIRTLVLLKLEAVGLRGARDLMPNQLSGGMARRVALARAIALDPDLMMYDEPFTGQDPISMGVLVKLIATLNRALSLTSIIVSHDIAETLSIADHVYVIADGKVVASGKPEDMQNDSSPELKQFFSGLPDGPIPFHYPAKTQAEDLLGEERV